MNRDESNKIIDLLLNNGFETTKDINGGFLTDSDLYFKNINYEIYLELCKKGIYKDIPVNIKNIEFYIVLNHINKKSKLNQCFDLWLSPFKHKKEIGNKKSIQNFCVRLGVQYDFLKDFLNAN